VKVPSSKLRAATGGAQARGAGQSISVNSRDKFVGGEILEKKRARNVKKSYVLESDSNEEEDEDMDDVVDDEDTDGESAGDDDDDDMDLDEDAQAEGEADGMDVPPPPPIIKVAKVGKDKPVVSVKPSPAKREVRSVEAKEAMGGSDDEELSELDSEIEDDEETMQVGVEDAEGEDEEIEVEGEEEEDEDELDSDEETPGGGSRASTPDLSKLTKRQRARLEEGGSGHLLALPDGIFCFHTTASCYTDCQLEVQVKKHLTAEEHAMRRAEMARRRKNLSEKRNEEEKVLQLCSRRLSSL
jgi:Ino eighty subunit 2